MTVDVDPEAVRLGQSYGLGEPLGVWRRELKRPRRMWWLGPVLAVLVAAVVPLAFGPLRNAAPFLAVMLLIVGFYALVVFLDPPPRVEHRLYGFAGGLVEVFPRWSPRVIRWDEVTNVVDQWFPANHEAPAVLVHEGWFLRTAEGDGVPVAAGYRNADLIYERAVSPVVARRVAAIREGAVVEYGGVRVTRDGIIGGKDKTVTPWAAIERVDLRPGRVRVRRVGGKCRRYDDHREPSGYAVFWQLLLALGVNATGKRIR